MTACAIVLLLGAAFLYFRSAPQPSVHRERDRAAVADELDTAQTSGQAQVEAAPRSSVVLRRTTPETKASSLGASRPTAPDLPPASAGAQQAMARLSQLDTAKPLTSEQAATVREDLHRLVSEGTGAVSAIGQFLLENKDLSLDEMKTGSRVGYSSLRAGLFDALRQIGGPESQAVLAETLRGTGDPGEIAMLTRHLEELAPGEYRDQALGAARDVLNQVAESKNKTDVGPLFQVLQTYGDGTVVSDVQKSLSQWKYYGAMTLAGMPEGKGIPALIEQAQQQGAGGAAKDVFLVQMLAQVAPQYPEASAALLEQAGAGQIPDRAWRRIADALAGDQYQFVKDPGVDPTILTRTPGLKTYHIEGGNENFYSVPLESSASAPELAQRRALIDQLLAATSNPAAVEALQKAKQELGH
jgi:hypothetical protein